MAKMMLFQSSDAQQKISLKSWESALQTSSHREHNWAKNRLMITHWNHVIVNFVSWNHHGLWNLPESAEQSRTPPPKLTSPSPPLGRSLWSKALPAFSAALPHFVTHVFLIKSLPTYSQNCFCLLENLD